MYSSTVILLLMDSKTSCLNVESFWFNAIYQFNLAFNSNSVICVGKIIKSVPIALRIKLRLLGLIQFK